jgi:hypothetical protein
MIVSNTIKIKKAIVRKYAILVFFLSRKKSKNKNAADKNAEIARNHL